jgi:hypothetical protein
MPPARVRSAYASCRGRNGLCSFRTTTLASLGVVEIERSAGHAERFNTRSMDRAGRE